MIFTIHFGVALLLETPPRQERIVYEVKDKEMTATAKGSDLITVNQISSATIIGIARAYIPIL